MSSQLFCFAHLEMRPSDDQYSLIPDFISGSTLHLMLDVPSVFDRTCEIGPFRKRFEDSLFPLLRLTRFLRFLKRPSLVVHREVQVYPNIIVRSHLQRQRVIQPSTPFNQH